MPNTRKKKEREMAATQPDEEPEKELIPMVVRRGRALSSDAFKHNLTKNYHIALEEHTSKVKTSFYWDHATFIPIEGKGENIVISTGSIIYGWSYSCPLLVLGFSSLNPKGETSLSCIVRDLFQIDPEYKLPEHITYKHPNKKNRLKNTFNDQKPYLKITIDSIVKDLDITYPKLMEDKLEYWNQMLFYFEHFARKPGQTVVIKKSHSIAPLTKQAPPPRRSPRQVTYSLPHDDDDSDTEETSEAEEGHDGDVLEALAFMGTPTGSSRRDETSNDSDDNRVHSSSIINGYKHVNGSDIAASIEKIAEEISQVHSRDVELIRELIAQQEQSRKYLEHSNQRLLDILSKQSKEEREQDSDEEPQKKRQKIN